MRTMDRLVESMMPRSERSWDPMRPASGVEVRLRLCTFTYRRLKTSVRKAQRNESTDSFCKVTLFADVKKYAILHEIA